MASSLRPLILMPSLVMVIVLVPTLRTICFADVTSTDLLLSSIRPASVWRTMGDVRSACSQIFPFPGSVGADGGFGGGGLKSHRVVSMMYSPPTVLAIPPSPAKKLILLVASTRTKPLAG